MASSTMLSLVNIMKESMEDPAGLFNARIVTKALRIIEITGYPHFEKVEPRILE